MTTLTIPIIFIGSFMVYALNFQKVKWQTVNIVIHPLERHVEKKSKHPLLFLAIIKLLILLIYSNLCVLGPSRFANLFCLSKSLQT